MSFLLMMSAYIILIWASAFLKTSNFVIESGKPFEVGDAVYQCQRIQEKAKGE